MSLSFNTVKLEAVTIDGMEYLPEITVERRLRLGKISAEREMSSEVLDLIAECFGSNKDAVRRKLDDFSIMAIYELMMYLMGGDEGLETLRAARNKGGKEGDSNA